MGRQRVVQTLIVVRATITRYSLPLPVDLTIIISRYTDSCPQGTSPGCAKRSALNEEPAGTDTGDVDVCAP